MYLYISTEQDHQHPAWAAWALTGEAAKQQD